MLDFSEVNGTYFLPYEFRAVEIDKPNGQEQVDEQSSVDKDLQSNDARNKEKDDDKALESHAKTKQDIVQVTPPSCSPNVFEEVCIGVVYLFSDLLTTSLLTHLLEKSP